MSTNNMRHIKIIIISSALVGFAGMFLYLLWLPWVPRAKHENPHRTALMDLRVRQAQKKGKKLTERMEWRDLSQISPNLRQAVFLAEDDTFYQNNGFDLDQILIAVKMNWEKKKYAYGGSTITQQLARTLYLSPRKSLLRKLKEAILTYWMAQALSKNRILEIYLNVIEWGDGIYGAEAAARHYYGKSCSNLSAEESVALASILPSPRKWSPLKVTPFMKRRRANILSRMGLPAIVKPDAAVPSFIDAPSEPSENLGPEMPEDDEEDQKGL